MDQDTYDEMTFVKFERPALEGLWCGRGWMCEVVECDAQAVNLLKYF